MHFLTWELIGWVDADVQSVFVTYDGVFNFGDFNKASGTDAWLSFNNNGPILIRVVRTDGNSYVLNSTYQYNPELDTQEIFFNLCSGVEFKYCQENPILSHTISWNYNAGGQLPNKTVTPVFTNPGAPSGQTKEYRLNGGAWLAYTVPLTIAPSWKVEFRWTLVYTLCTIVLYDCLTEEACSFP